MIRWFLWQTFVVALLRPLLRLLEPCRIRVPTAAALWAVEGQGGGGCPTGRPAAPARRPGLLALRRETRQAMPSQDQQEEI